MVAAKKLNGPSIVGAIRSGAAAAVVAAPLDAAVPRPSYRAYQVLSLQTSFPPQTCCLFEHTDRVLNCLVLCYSTRPSTKE
ncbi:hypothetical protein BDZ89DRAFT_271752 [Hymenopellis radicata]|nr:hypothetical protein BDZ89DRAFT_271752 [Hymenopellis radicata]